MPAQQSEKCFGFSARSLKFIVIVAVTASSEVSHKTCICS